MFKTNRVNTHHMSSQQQAQIISRLGYAYRYLETRTDVNAAFDQLIDWSSKTFTGSKSAAHVEVEALVKKLKGRLIRSRCFLSSVCV